MVQVSSCLADPKIIFATALKARASSIVLAHNHPPGNLTPSKSDILMTRKLMEAAKLLDMLVVDHIIVTPDGYNSFANEGWVSKNEPKVF